MTIPWLSMNEVTTYRWSFEQDVQRYRSAGYEAIGVWRQKLNDFGEERGIDLLAESGLRVTNLFWAGGFTGSDGRSLEDSIEDASQAIRLAGAMSAGCLVIYSGGRNNHIYPHAERLFRTAICNLLELAEAADVVLAIEPMHPACAADWTFLTDLESTIAFIDSFDSPFLKLVFDTYHYGHDRSVLANLREIVPYTALVQLGDRRTAHGIDQDRCSLGLGQVPWDEIVYSLLENGYQGDFDVELVGQDIQPNNYQSLLDSSRQVFEQLFLPVAEH